MDPDPMQFVEADNHKERPAPTRPIRRTMHSTIATALTQKRWPLVVALFPTLFGVIMGFAGQLGWHIHPNMLTKLLS